MYITLHSQELKMCKRIGYKYYCEELFVIKSKMRYSCTSAIYINLESDVIKANSEFQYYYNKTDIKPTVLDGGFQIILANWPNYRKIMCLHNNNIPINIPGHPYVLMNRSILTDNSKKFCGILPYFGSPSYLYQRMPMRLNISPPIWQSYINAILNCLQSSKYCEAIMDDLLLFHPNQIITF